MADLSNIFKFIKSYYLGLEGDRTVVPHPKLAKNRYADRALTRIVLS